MTGQPLWLVAGRASADALVERTREAGDVARHGRTRPAGDGGRAPSTDPRRAPVDLGAVDLAVELDRTSRDLAWLLTDLSPLPSPKLGDTAARFSWIATTIHTARPGPSRMRLVDELVAQRARADRALGHPDRLVRLDARCMRCGRRTLMVRTSTWESTCAYPGCVDDDGTPSTWPLANHIEVVVYAGHGASWYYTPATPA